MSHRGQLPTSIAPSRIAVVRALPGLGDFLCSIPTLRSLRAGFPEAHIALIGLPQAGALVERFSGYLGELVPFPGYPGIPEGWRGSDPLLPFLQAVRSPRFDIALQLHGSGRYSNPFTLLLGARRTLGFYQPGDYCPTADFVPYPEAMPEVRRGLLLLDALGVPAWGSDLEFPIAPAEREECAQLLAAAGLRRPYVCLHPGASTRDRRWDPRGFAAVGQTLAQRGYTVVLTGSAAERAVARAVAQQIQGATVTLTGATDLGVLAALLEQASLLVCNDTGVSHLAAALKLPSVVIFSDSDPRRWAPLDSQRHRAVVHTGDDTVSTVLAHCQSLLPEPAAGGGLCLR